MKDFIELLMGVTLFHNITDKELEALLTCLGGCKQCYDASAFLLLAGQKANKVGIMLEGRALVVKEEYDGTRMILTELRSGDLFAETFACASQEQKVLPVSVVAETRSTVLWIDYRKIIRSCPAGCAFHTRLIENMLTVLANKNLMLNERLSHLSKRSTREKLLSYLSEQAARAGGGEFTIPFNRQELADYLCVERSAMSAVLSRLRSEGILETNKNQFLLKKSPH